MNIVFFGTPYFAAASLNFLLDAHVKIKAIVTQPDRPKGRSLQMTPSLVKSLALEKAPHIPLLQPEKASQESFLQELQALQADLFVVVAYGQILPQKLLDIPRLGCINVHASLLPKYRGAAPMQRALLNGETETGIAIQKMVKQLDAGDVIASSKMKISSDMTLGELEKELIALSNPLLLSVLREYEKGVPKATPQDPSQVSWAPKIEPEEGLIDWNLPAQKIHNQIRAFSPKPGAWCWVEVGAERRRLKILKSQVIHNRLNVKELGVDGCIGCGEESLKLIEVQPEGKKAMPASDWLRGQKNIYFV